MQESKPDKKRKSLRIVGWWWDELTLNEVRVENMIYQKEYDITQSCKKKKNPQEGIRLYFKLHVFTFVSRRHSTKEKTGERRTI